MKKIGILRGLMPRLSQAEFSASFSKFVPVFVSGEASEEVNDYCKKIKLQQRDLQNVPLYPIDPTALIGRRHQSWVGVDNLLEASKDLNILETYELYHFFSGQAADVSEKLRIPLVCEVWTSFSKHPAYFLPPYVFTAKKVITKTSLFIARSEKAKQSLLELGVPLEKIQMIYHGVNLERFQPKKKKFSQTLLYVGELEMHKGVSLLLDIWPRVIEDFPKANLILAGKGSLAEQASATPHTELLGYIPHEDLPAVYANADLFISISQDRYVGPFLWWEEFFSYTLMEALACGLPIIGSNSGGILEEVGSENWIIPQKDGEALYQSIVEALSYPKHLKKLGEKNRKRAEEKFDLKKQTKLLEKELEILNSRNH